MKGMEGVVDSDGNNEITARELHAYVRENGAQRGDTILEQLGSLPNASSPKAMLQVRNVHVDSLTAITTFLASS